MSFSFLPSPPVTAAQSPRPAVPAWAAPFDGGGCGPNLEYDNAYLELFQAACGKPETQFQPAIAPNWNVVEASAICLLQRSRDLSLVVLWAESQLNLKGFASLPDGLHALAALLETAWPTVNPPLDNGDAYARVNAIAALGLGGSYFQSLRNCWVVRHPRIGEMRLKDFEALAGKAQDTECMVTRDQVDQFFASVDANADELHQLVKSSLAGLTRVRDALADHIESEKLPQFSEYKSLLGHLLSCLPKPVVKSCFNDSIPIAGPEISPLLQTNAAQSVEKNQSLVQSRAQALLAIDQVCLYLEQAEPTNPAQFLLKRAHRLIDKNFMQLMKELAPEALAEVAKIMGINPDSLEQEDA